MSLLNKILILSPATISFWGYWIVLLSSFAEATPFLGLFIPGQTLVIMGGFFSRLGILNFMFVLFLSATGAIVGDLIGYEMGKKYGYPFIKKYEKKLKIDKKYYKKTKSLINLHPGKTLIFGRFNSLTRSFSPFIAGSTKLPFLKFMSYNLIGGISWAIVFVSLGYFLGMSYKIAARYIGGFVALAIILILALWYIYKLINKKRKILSKENFYLILVNIFSIYLFSKMIEDILDKELMFRIDLWVNSKIVLFQTHFLDKLMIFLASLFSPISLIGISVLIFIWLLYKKKNKVAWLFSLAIVGGAVLEIIIKEFMQRARPENALVHLNSYSFPSGHATIAIIFFSSLIYLFGKEIKNEFFKYSFLTTNIFLIILIGFNRIYLNVHWFSDVIGGYSLGLFWLTFLLLISKKELREIVKKIY